MKSYLTLTRTPVLAVLMIAAVIFLPGTASAQGCRGRATNVVQPPRWSSTLALTPPAVPYTQLPNTWQFQAGVQPSNRHNQQWYAGQYGYSLLGPIPGVHGSYAFPYGYGYGHGYVRPYMRQISHLPRPFRRHR